jgi:hypothetical protein
MQAHSIPKLMLEINRLKYPRTEFQVAFILDGQRPQSLHIHDRYGKESAAVRFMFDSRVICYSITSDNTPRR